MARFWSNTLMLPFYVAAGSLVLLFLRALWAWRSTRLKITTTELVNTSESDTNPASGSIASHLQQHGGKQIFAFKLMRLFGCLIILSLSIISFVLEDNNEQKESSGRPWMEENTHRSLQFALCLTYLYVSILAIVSVAGSVKWSRIVVLHLNVVLFTTFCVYFYRDIFPLATFPLTSLDISEGSLLWIKIFILFAISGIIPLVIPRQYIPVDPKRPMSEPNPEQTASFLSLALYSFLDKLIFLGYRVPHLAFEQLPPLADYDHMQNLKNNAFPHVDVFAGVKRHVFFGIIWIYRWKFLSMTIVISITAMSHLISPLGLNRLLNYLENPSEEPLMKPWFWILLLLLGPAMVSLSRQWYMFLHSQIMAQTTAILTQLVFEHALRIRVKHDTADNETLSQSKANANLLGKITNLVTTDLANINLARNILFLLVFVPIQLTGAVIFLYQVLDWSALVGMGVMVALFPLPGYMTKLQQTAQRATLAKTDARVQTVSETMNVIRMIKMFGWEKQMDHRIASKREAELRQLWRRKVLDLASGSVNFLSPIITMLTTFGSGIFLVLSYITLIAKEELSASKVFSSMPVFELLRYLLMFGFLTVSEAVNAKTSLDRLDSFLRDTELLDSFTSKIDALSTTLVGEADSDLIGFRDSTFAWSEEDADGTLTPASRRFLLKIEGQLFFKRGCINLVVGPTGSGKTSLIMALLGEMHLVRSSTSSWYNLPRGRGVSYAAQESWVMNDTIKNNILFNSPMDETRYKKVLFQCCLERDLEMWKAGDEIEVGEKGLSLSGGQKARVTLARAIYADTEVILLDDVLAALDVHTAKWVVEKCLQGDLVRNRTVILVTHNVAMTSKLAEFVVSLGLDGRVRSQGSIYDALAKDEVLAQEVRKDEESFEAAEKEIESALSGEQPKKTATGQLTVTEEVAIGRVHWSALLLYFQGMGGTYPVPFFVLLVFIYAAVEVSEVLQTWYSGYWASQYGQDTPVAVFKYLGGFSAILVTCMILYSTGFLLHTIGGFRASRTLHSRLVQSILGTTLRWLDITPVSRIIARLTVDMNALDNFIPEGLREFLATSLSLLTKFFAVVIYAPIFFFAGAIVGLAGLVCGRIYMASQLSVKREQSLANAPVLAHFGATMAGLTSVRAYGAQEAMIQISIDRINRFTRVQRTFSNLGRWVSTRIELLGGVFAASLAYYVVYIQPQRPFNVGFSLAMAVDFAQYILYWVQELNALEIRANSLERIQQYLAVEQEPKPTLSGVPPAYWPASGNLSVDKLSAKYSPDGEEVLHDLSFNINSGERVGIVGRTGSGKSSLTLSLLRLILTEGTVYYDGIATSSLNLDALRSAITIIPQVPELLVGSLRLNLDIFGQLDDAMLNGALRAAGLTALQAEMTGDDAEGRLTLDTEIAAGGGNLSVGQRQIIALARAIVQGSKLLILDEATSAIDYQTDTVIQASLRTELPADTTILTVAHRLQTIMDADKIMVLDTGTILEFDSPKVLLLKKDGLLRALVEESGDRDALFKMAGVPPPA